MADRYEIIGRLGRGGLGVVYRARDKVMGREVAVKRLLPPEESTSNEEASVESLKREAAALARFQHSNIVSIYSLEEDSEGPFVVTELIEGENLHNIVINGALPYKDFEAVAEQTLEPLIAAQKAGLMHRDIKPANIMLSELPSGKFIVKILDFGLAKFSQKPSTQTLDLKGTFLGSIDFIAPEQLELEPLDHRTDLYSLGCVLYYCLTQDSPFSGANAAETSQNHLNHKCIHLSELRPDVPGPVADWVMTLVERNPDDRPETATIALKEFEEAKKGISPAKNRLQEQRITDSIDVVEAADSIHAAEGARSGDKPSTDTGRVLMTGPVKRAAPRSSAAPSQAVDRSPEGSGISRKTVMLIGGGVLAFLMVVIFLIAGGGDDPPESAVTKGGGLDPSENIPEDLPAEPLPKPGNVELPDLDSNQAGSPIRVTNGLVANFKANLGTYHYDMETAPRPGQKLAAWRNLASSNPKSYLTYDWSDPRAQFVPVMDRVGTEDFPVLNGLFRAVHFSNRDFMQSPQPMGDFSKGITLLVVGRFNLVGERILQFTPDKHDGRIIALESSYGGTIQARFRGAATGTSADIQQTHWNSGDLGVITYHWDPAKGTQMLRGVTAEGKRFNEGAKSVGTNEIPFSKLAVGPRKFQEGLIAEPKSLFFELTVYERPLSDQEMTAMENQLASKYFGLKFDRVNLTGIGKGKDAPALETKNGPGPGPGPGPAAAISDGIPAEGLVSHHTTDDRVYTRRVGGVVAKPGDPVLFWKAGDSHINAHAPHNSKTDQVPTFYEAADENDLGLKPGAKLLNFGPDTALLIQEISGLEDTDGLSLVLVAQVVGDELGPFAKIDAVGNNYSWASLIPNERGIAGKIGVNPTTKEREALRIKLDAKQIAIYSLIWDGKKGEMSLQARLDGGELIKGKTGKAYQGKVHLSRINLGTIKYNQHHLLFEGKIGDVFLYNRALAPAERKNLEDHLAAKFFQEP